MKKPYVKYPISFKIIVGNPQETNSPPSHLNSAKLEWVQPALVKML